MDKAAAILTRSLLVAVVLSVHVVAQFFLYGERVHRFLNEPFYGTFRSDILNWEWVHRLLGQWPTWLFESDLFVFLLPGLGAFGLDLLILRILWPPPLPRTGTTIAVAGALTFLSWWAGMFVSLNTYGE